ncbi:hypothetical protein SAMN04489761_0656 [Tenacibaculum sp. MAR_2009_124]|uniref:hypothetical protein n=1 Tax=Tenacibaculum sp. MAR_2009_124 TaxID=1250059 RepID=UPI00089659EF|nr:hypothetical protein [Tenacibaculum sp. MAR_2009_124]SEB42868.1 hypothetical protein SAMN04489761_0656 [Tenacibaculum sp. MAR_2009_124]
MKKFLVAAIMLFGLAVNAQEGELNVGGTIGLPVGDASDAFDVTGSIEANYLFSVSEKFKVGPSVSYVHFNGEGADVAFLPLAAAARYSVSDKFIVGADLGYGIGVRPEGNDGGFYYRPMVGYKVTDKITLHANYSAVNVSQSVDLGVFGSVSASATYGTFGIGGTYSFSL